LVLVTDADPPAADWAAAVELGAERVAVLPADEAWLLSRAARAALRPVERGRLAVVSGSCGGAGTSTLAATLALAAASRSEGALLVDADPYGGGLDLLLGAEREEGLRWPELAGLRGRVSGDALLAALPETTGVHVLAGSRDSPCAVPDEALVAVVEAGRAAGRPVVVDLPRDKAGTDLLEEADLVAMVVPARLRAACAARLLVGSDGDGPGRWSRAQIVVRRLPGGLTADDVADLVGREVLAELPHDRWAVSRGERGEPPGIAPKSAWGSVCRRLLEVLDTDGPRR
jgi:secretion/DNA translocation related CpaE-like protein